MSLKSKACCPAPQGPPSSTTLRPGTSGQAWRPRPRRTAYAWCAAWFLAAAASVSAQDALWVSLSSRSAAAFRRASLENIPYTVRWGELKLGASASLGAEWNDNVSLRNSNPQADLILQPMAKVDAFWPVTDLNLLTFSVGVGYVKFLRYDQYDQLLVSPGSALDWVAFIKDWGQLEFHDQVSYEQEPTVSGAISGTGIFGGLYNVAGLLATWNLHDLTLSFGYDHVNFVAGSSLWDYLTRASDFGNLRASLRVLPTLTNGLEISGGPTAYQGTTVSAGVPERLNNNTSFSIGPFADWGVTDHIQFELRGGYFVYSFSDLPGKPGGPDQTGYYFSANLAYHPRKNLSFWLGGGHQAYAGNFSALTESWHAQLGVSCRLMRHLDLSTSLGYETATQPIPFSLTNGGFALSSDSYQRYSIDLKLSRVIRDKLTASLDYRCFFKNDQQHTEFGYAQNRLSLQLAYHF